MNILSELLSSKYRCFVPPVVVVDDFYYPYFIQKCIEQIFQF